MVIESAAIPFINLQEELEGVGVARQSQEVVIVHYGEKRIGLLVEMIAGKFQAVLKPLGRYFNHLDIVSGATILGDGTVAPILDLHRVAQNVIREATMA